MEDNRTYVNATIVVEKCLAFVLEGEDCIFHLLVRFQYRVGLSLGLDCP